MRTILALFPILAFASPVMAQQHDGHGGEHPNQTPSVANSSAHQMDHRGTDHSAMNKVEMDRNAIDHAQMNHVEMDHGQMDQSHMEHGMMDHSGMGYGQMEHGARMEAAPIPAGPPPKEAFSGPAHAADQFVGAEKMSASRADVVKKVSGMTVFWFQADRAEYRAHKGKDGYLWDVQGYYGGDIDKFWFKSEGEGHFGEKIEDAEVQALWSHAIGPWFDLQAGVRQDLVGPERTHAVIGVQGLAPYLFEVDAAAFVSNKGDVTARIEAELDQRITQRLILQPRAEFSFAAQDIPELAIGAGIDRIEAGIRLRYEFAREFAPYVGVEQEWKLGDSADYARARGEGASTTSFVAGIRFWF
jgi:copper resistance protein B